MPSPPPDEAVESADAVFIGEVVNMDSRRLRGAQELLVGIGRVFREEVLGLEPRDEDDDAIRRRLRVWLRVKEAFKGVAAHETVLARTALFEASCGFSFERDQSYLVYLYRERGGELHASLCSRSRPLERAAEDLTVLRRLSPRPGESPPAGLEHEPLEASIADLPGNIMDHAIGQVLVCAQDHAGVFPPLAMLAQPSHDLATGLGPSPDGAPAIFEDRKPEVVLSSHEGSARHHR